MLDKINGPAQPSSQAGSGGGVAAEKGAGGNRAAWLREMERQEMTSWLRHDSLPPAKREPNLFRQAPQSIVAADGPAAEFIRDDASVQVRDNSVETGNLDRQQGPRTEALPTTVQASCSPSGPGANVASATLRYDSLGLRDKTIAAGQLLPAMAARGNSPDGFAAYVMSQLVQPPGASTTFSAAPTGMAALQPSQYGHPGPAPLAAVVGSVPGFELAGAEPEADQQSLEAALPDGEDELTAQRNETSSLPRDGESPPPVRVHAFWSDQSVRVWVGTDQSGALDEQQLALAAQDVRRLLREQGVTLESLTVNGETVVAQDEALADNQDGGPASELATGRTILRPTGQRMTRG